MRADQLIVRAQEGRATRYRLTPRGEDAVFILLAFLRYGTRHYSGDAQTIQAGR
ncbi:MAG: hypothetical protein L3K17_00045 [Thermoplasmata archaeon]|nr:hypothetical protein [Thermoplasmata archaeon]